MEREHRVDRRDDDDPDEAAPLPAPGRRTLTGRLGGGVDAAAVVRAMLEQLVAGSDAQQGAASAGVAGASSPLPHLAEVQRAFGRHDLSQVRAQVGGAAAEASSALGAQAYALGDRVGFAGAPDLGLAAHEAAHVVQQRAGVQRSGGAQRDEHEEHADAVAAAVVRGESAEPLLDRYRGARGGVTVQLSPESDRLLAMVANLQNRIEALREAHPDASDPARQQMQQLGADRIFDELTDMAGQIDGAQGDPQGRFARRLLEINEAVGRMENPPERPPARPRSGGGGGGERRRAEAPARVGQYPDYFGERSIEAMQQIEAQAEAWGWVGRLTLGATVLTLASNATEPGVPTTDLDNEAGALDGATEICRHRIVDIATLTLARDGLNPQEQRFWQRLIEHVNRAGGGRRRRRAQRKAAGGAALDGAAAERTAADGFAGAPRALPHLDDVQRAFGHHDVSDVRAHVGGPAAQASAALGAHAYASGDDVAFARDPDLFLVAHEVAHVVQQRGGVQLSGGFGAEGDAHEQHADEVAATVVRGDSAEGLLDRYTGGAPRRAVQRFSAGQTPAERANEARQRLDQLAQQPEAAQRTEIASWTREFTEELLDAISDADRANYADLIRLIRGERTASAAEGGQGQYRWVRSGPTRDHDEGTQQSTRSDYRPATHPGRTNDAPTQNDFALWVRGEGPEPGPESAMNCWEAVFYSAYRAGIVPQSFLRSLHERAAGAGQAARRGAEQTSRTPEAGTPQQVGSEAYYRVLEAALGLPGAVDITDACPALQRGDIVFFNGLAHVAVATGGGNRIQSLWTIPDQGPDRRDSFQSTTVDELLRAMEQNLMDRQRVQVAPCPW